MTDGRAPEERRISPVIANRVLLTLLVAALLGAALLPFAAMAPNRLMSGQSVGVTTALLPWQWLSLAALAGVLALCALPRPFPARAARWVTLGAAPLWLLLVLYGLGDYATRALQDASSAARVSQGAAFWILVFCPVLMIVDAFQRLNIGLALRGLYT
ncbi:ABC transporter permease, partial [Halomonas sp. BBD48]|nr:ABC transporter permease [Halomonas sp. BBD48]